jgi:hypothetical protein
MLAGCPFSWYSLEGMAYANVRVLLAQDVVRQEGLSRGELDMNNAKVTVLFLVVLLSLCSSGCLWLAVGAAGAGVGVGTYAYVRGELEAAYASGYNETWAATLAALDALEIRKKSATRDAFGGSINAARADGTSIKIKVTPVSPAHTSVKIRVGFFGNRTMSEGIADQIGAKL